MLSSEYKKWCTQLRTGPMRCWPSWGYAREIKTKLRVKKDNKYFIHAIVHAKSSTLSVERIVRIKTSRKSFNILAAKLMCVTSSYSYRCSWFPACTSDRWNRSAQTIVPRSRDGEKLYKVRQWQERNETKSDEEVEVEVVRTLQPEWHATKVRETLRTDDNNDARIG